MQFPVSSGEKPGDPVCCTNKANWPVSGRGRRDGRGTHATNAGPSAPNKTPATKVERVESKPRFGANIADYSERLRLLSGASNKANRPAGRYPSFQYSRVPSRCGSYKQSQFPRGGRDAEQLGLLPFFGFFRFFRLSPVRLRPDFGPSRASGALRRGFVRNKANWGERKQAVPRYKQSQFSGQASVGPLPAWSPGAIVRNKADFGGVSSWKWQVARGQGKVLPVFPLREETPCGVTTNTPVPCQTKPICLERIREDGLSGRGWGERRQAAHPYKQSQFGQDECKSLSHKELYLAVPADGLTVRLPRWVSRGATPRPDRRGRLGAWGTRRRGD